MGNFGKYMSIIAGIDLVFYFFGLVGTNSFINILLSPQTMSSGTIWTVVTAFLIGSTITGVSLFGATINLQYAAKAIAMTTLILIGLDFISIFNVMRALNPVFAILLFSPIIYLYFITTMEWVTSSD